MPILKSSSPPPRKRRSTASRATSNEDLVFWEQNQARVQGYVLTNGNIEITLCGLYATTVSVLIAFGQGPAAKQNFLVFQLVIPLFSLVVLSLSSNVYTWIRLQLEYLAIFSHHPKRLERTLTWEEWRAETSDRWHKFPVRRRAWLVVRDTVVCFATLPLRLNNIYRYYILLYVSVAIASITFPHYASHRGFSLWYPVGLCIVMLFFLGAGTLDVVKFSAVGDGLRDSVLRPPEQIEIEEVTDDY